MCVRHTDEPFEGPGELVGRGLVAGQYERHQLVADLTVVERPALLVTGREQEREHVGAPLGFGDRSARGDRAVVVGVDPVEDDLHEPLRLGVRGAQDLEHLPGAALRELEGPAGGVA